MPEPFVREPGASNPACTAAAAISRTFGLARTRPPRFAGRAVSVALRHPKPPAEFAAKLAAKNEQLEELDLPGLILEEFHAARLYTGPMVSSRAARGCLVAAPVG